MEIVNTIIVIEPDPTQIRLLNHLQRIVLPPLLNAGVETSMFKVVSLLLAVAYCSMKDEFLFSVAPELSE